MSTTKNPNQRYHLVLAESYTKARPILERLRRNGLLMSRVKYVRDETELLGMKGEQVAFIFGPDYSGNPRWSRMNQTITRMLLHEGAVKKADPEAVFQKQEAERKAEAARAEARAKAAEERKAQQESGIFKAPTGGLWDQIKGPGGVYVGNAPFVTYAKTHIGYKQYFVGGPHHGKRCKDFPTADGGEVEIPVRSTLSFAPGLSFTKSRYRAYTAEILGQPVLFWVHSASWSDRQRLVRDFVLMPLEV